MITTFTATLIIFYLNKLQSTTQPPRPRHTQPLATLLLSLRPSLFSISTNFSLPHNHRAGAPNAPAPQSLHHDVIQAARHLVIEANECQPHCRRQLITVVIRQVIDADRDLASIANGPARPINTECLAAVVGTTSDLAIGFGRRHFSGDVDRNTVHKPDLPGLCRGQRTRFVHGQEFVDAQQLGIGPALSMVCRRSRPSQSVARRTCLAF